MRIPSNLVGFVALCFALTGGVAWATHPGGQNTISSADIINGEVRNNDLAPDSVGSGKIADRQVKNADLSIGASSSNTIADGGIQGVDVKSETLTGAHVDDGSLTGADIDQSTLDFWSLAGNAGTSAADFLGTTDNQALALRVNDARALRLEPASDGTNVSPNLIGGIADNTVTAGVHSATIAGGGRRIAANPATANRVTDNGGTIGGGAENEVGNGDANFVNRGYGTVSGGQSNTASGSVATVGGGSNNTASDLDTTVGGGGANSATEDFATVGGGLSNTAGASDATVAGGSSNDAIGTFAAVGGGLANSATGSSSAVGGGNGNAAGGVGATVPGGVQNVAAGGTSFAAGRRAKADDDGAFVWGDSTNADIASTEENQFIARASGGFFLQDDSSLDDQGGYINTSTEAFLSTTGVWVNGSDENMKQGFEAINPGRVLAKVAAMPVTRWAYKAEPGVEHIGPVAQDFYRAFGLGEDNRHIGSIDADGVALAAIKGLNRRLERQQRQIARLRARLAAGARR